MPRSCLASGHAYYCFCTKEELEQRRAAAAAAGPSATIRRHLPQDFSRRRRATPRRWRSRRPAFRRARIRQHVFRRRRFGRVEFANTELEDFVLLRSDGVPTYHLSVVTDDVDMRITHIIRGADHISNTPKQVLLYQALGAPLPVFAHVPLILGPDKTRLSKRHGATSVIAYRDEGIVPGSFPQFSGAAGMDAAGIRSGSGVPRKFWRPGTHSAVRSRRHLALQRRFRSRQAGLVQHRIHPRLSRRKIAASDSGRVAQGRLRARSTPTATGCLRPSTCSSRAPAA